MQSNTISVSPIPHHTTPQQIKTIFHAFSVKNVHIQGNTAYVQFLDQGDLQNLDIQFDNYTVSQLNNAQIDKAQFDWNSVSTKKQNTSPDKKSSSSSSSQHQDLMAADIDNLIVIQKCDQYLLRNLSQEQIRQILKDFHSVHRIVRRKKQVIVQFTDAGQLQLLQTKFENLHVGQLGFDAVIQKADRNRISAQQFVSQWSKLHTKQSQLSQQSTSIGYKQEKPSSYGQLHSQQQERFNIESQQSRPSQQVLHQDIIPPFDKKTSMQVNFLNQQSKLGYKQQLNQHEPISQATTKQQLDFTSEIQIQDQDRFGYQAFQKQQQKQKERQAQLQRKKKQEQQRIKKQEAQKIRKQKQEQKRLRKQKEQEQRIRRIKQQEQRIRKTKQQEKRKQQQMIKLKYQQQARKRKQQQQSARKAAEQQARRRRQSQLLDKQLKQKLYAQRQKFNKEQQLNNQLKQQQHHPPTDSYNPTQQLQPIKQFGQSIQQQLGYAVNKAKSESANLLNAGLQLLKTNKQTNNQQTKYLGYDSTTAQSTHDAKQESKPMKQKQQLGYKNQNPKQLGMNLISSSLQFLKGSYYKIQQVAHKAKEAGPQQLGYEKWSVKPDVNVPRPVAGHQPRTLKTLITLSLLIWDTNSQDVESNNDIGIPIQTGQSNGENQFRQQQSSI